MMNKKIKKVESKGETNRLGAKKTRVDNPTMLKSSVVKARNAIKKKFRDLHNEKFALTHYSTEKYQPIIEPLKELVSETKKNKKTPHTKYFKRKKIEKSDEEFDFDGNAFRTALPIHRKKLFAAEANKSPYIPFQTEGSTRPNSQASGDFNDVRRLDSIDSFASATEQDEEGVAAAATAAAASDINDGDLVEEKLVKKVEQLQSPSIESVYGFRRNPKNELVLGKQVVTIKNEAGNLKYRIKNKEFVATRGLTDLLLMTKPKNYSENDLDTYKEMLKYTSAHKINCKPKSNIIRNKNSIKYSNIISVLFPEKKSQHSDGKGLGKLQMNYKLFNKNGKFNYTYWDDPNELVNRLRLLIASQSAGHSGHTNEIISIIEELREASIIK